MTLEARKYHIIEQITDIQDDKLLIRLENLFNEFLESARKATHLMKPMRSRLMVEELVMEQEYRGINKNAFDQLLDDIHVEEPIEDLIAMI